jgi:3-oxoacyl-[acyl-carrier protein] reductase
MSSSATDTTRVALVTGASKGIGKAAAERLARDGFAVLIHYGGDEAGAKATVADIEAAGGKARALRADVTRAADVARLFEETIAALGRIDVVFNNAGINIAPTPLAQMEEADFDRVMNTNMKGAFLVMREAARRVADDGRIINVSTTMVAQPRPNGSIYSASKAAVESMTRILAREIASRRVTVNAVAPGPVDTALFRAGKTEAALKMAAEFSPLNRVGQPDEIAAVVSFLASPQSSWVTGQIVRANGGWF